MGYTYYINNVLLDEPHLEVIEDFVEIEDPNKDETNEEHNTLSKVDEDFLKEYDK